MKTQMRFAFTFGAIIISIGLLGAGDLPTTFAESQLASLAPTATPIRADKSPLPNRNVVE